MESNAKTRKKIIRRAIIGVLALDLVLVIVNWRLAALPHEQPGDIRALERTVRLLEADVKRVQSIETEMPATQLDLDRFFSERLRRVSSGYSSIVSDLGTIAGKAGLHTTGITFHQREIPNRGVVEIEVTTSVDGGYASLVKFINGLERSGDFYVLDHLSLTSVTAGSLKLNLQLRTYFRS